MMKSGVIGATVGGFIGIIGTWMFASHKPFSDDQKKSTTEHSSNSSSSLEPTRHDPQFAELWLCVENLKFIGDYEPTLWASLNHQLRRYEDLYQTVMTAASMFKMGWIENGETYVMNITRIMGDIGRSKMFTALDPINIKQYNVDIPTILEIVNGAQSNIRKEIMYKSMNTNT